MLKLSTSTMQKKPIAVSCSEEALVESIQALSAASESLYSACADAEEASTVLANLDMCVNAVKVGGLTKQVITTFNAEGELSACVGQECLTVAGLEALGADQVKALSATYSAGLEGKMAEYWNKFVAMLKNVWAKIKNWFATLWQNRARLFKSLSDYNDYKTLNGDKEIAVMSKTDLDKLFAVRTQTINALNAFKTDYAAGKNQGGDALAAAIEKANKDVEELTKTAPEAGKLSAKGWTLDEFKKAAGYIQTVIKPANGGFTKWIDDEMKKLIDIAGQAGKETDETKSSNLKAEVARKRDGLNKALAAVRADQAIILKAFTQVHKIKSACSKADKKEEPKTETK